MKAWITVRLILAILLVGQSFELHSAEEPKLPMVFVLSVTLRPIKREFIELNNEYILLPEVEPVVRPGGVRPSETQSGAGAARRVPVRLVRTRYICNLLEVRGGTVTSRTTGPDCVELWSDDVYTWSIFGLGNHAAHFRLFPLSPGQNYLAWVDGSSVRFTEVSETKDRIVAFHETLFDRTGPPIWFVPVRELVPEAVGWGLNALYFDIDVRSIERPPAGGWILKIGPLGKSEAYTLVYEDGKWRRE